MLMDKEKNLEVNFTSHNIEFELQDQQIIISWLKCTARDFNNSIKSLNYYFCDDQAIHEVNLSYLNHDYPTDIITFPYEYNPVEAEIYISIDTINENAKRYNVSFDQELRRVIIHGLLHMLGMDDRTDELQIKMTMAEDKYLDVLIKLCLKKQLDEDRV